MFWGVRYVFLLALLSMVRGCEFEFLRQRRFRVSGCQAVAIGLDAKGCSVHSRA